MIELSDLGIIPMAGKQILNNLKLFPYTESPEYPSTSMGIKTEYNQMIELRMKPRFAALRSASALKRSLNNR